MKQAVYQSVVYQEGKHYVAQCLDIDISSFGKTEQEALDNLQEALELYLEDAPSISHSAVKHPTLHTLRPHYA
jgi:predicted RNase H-like HicB family nuclease